MNIVHMIDSEGMFGAEYVLYYLLPCLQRSGVNVLFACLSPVNSPGAELGRRLEKKSIPVVYLDEKKRISANGLISIFRLLKSSNAEILHVHGYKAAVLGGIVSKFARLPIFSTYHAESAMHPELLNYFKIETYFLKKAARIMAVSAAIKEDLIRRGIPEKTISIIPNGIEDPAGSHPHQTGSVPCRILCLGRLVRIKRFDLVIQALSILSEEFSELELTISGSGPLEGALKDLIIDLGLSRHVRITGYVSDTAKLYANSDIFVLPSETEGAPISVIEAMAFSLPVIASSVGSIPEMLQDECGILLSKPASLDQLVTALRSLITGPEYRRKLGMAARVRYEENFTSTSMASKYIDEYSKCMEGRLNHSRRSLHHI